MLVDFFWCFFVIEMFCVGNGYVLFVWCVVLGVFYWVGQYVRVGVVL